MWFVALPYPFRLLELLVRLVPLSLPMWCLSSIAISAISAKSANFENRTFRTFRSLRTIFLGSFFFYIFLSQPFEYHWIAYILSAIFPLCSMPLQGLPLASLPPAWWRPWEACKLRSFRTILLKDFDFSFILCTFAGKTNNHAAHKHTK